MTRTIHKVTTSSRIGWWVETIFALVIVLLVLRVAWLFDRDGYLPQPFFYDPTDTFMDWFNTAYWARDPGAYDSWRTIYPPLTFVVLRFFGIDSCYVSNEGVASRDCDWVGIVVILIVFVLNFFLLLCAFRKTDPKTAVQRTIALGSGMPMLFALERGNVLLLTFTCVLLAFGPLVRSARLRWLAAGLAINFKVYLVAAFAVQVLKRRWRWTEGTAIATLGVYLVSYLVYGAGSPIEIFGNISSYSSNLVASQVLDIYYMVTYQSLTNLLQSMIFPITNVVGSDVAETGLIVISLITLIGQATILLALIASCIRPEPVSPIRLAALGICLALISSEAGGYTQILIILFVFMEPWKGFTRPVALLFSYILCLPGEVILGLGPTLTADSWLSGQHVQFQIGIGLGFFLRPGLVIIIAISLAAGTIFDVAREIRVRGWHNHAGTSAIGIGSQT